MLIDTTLSAIAANRPDGGRRFVPATDVQRRGGAQDEPMTAVAPAPTKKRNRSHRPPQCIVTPEVARYDLLREEWGLGDERPAALAVVEWETDLAEVEAFAEAWDLKVVVASVTDAATGLALIR